jgi:hypothetical protein
MIELFEFGLSGNCHKVRMMLSLLRLEYKSHAVNGAEREQKSDAYLSMNPFGQVPVLKEGDTIRRVPMATIIGFRQILHRQLKLLHGFQRRPMKLRVGLMHCGCITSLVEP